MIWLALVFVWFALTVLRGAREQFAWGALWSAFFVVGTLHVLSPDDFIVRTNVGLLREGRIFDANYAANLSDDATPALLENLSAMSFEQQCAVKVKIGHRFETSQTETDFRTWNWSRFAARNVTAQHGESLDTSNCPDYTKHGDRFLGEY